MDQVIDQVRLDVVSPKNPLLGLNDALAKLKAIGAAIDLVNGRLAGLNTMSAFKRTKAELAEVLRGFSEGTRKIVPLKSVANALGIPDQKDFDAFMLLVGIQNPHALSIAGLEFGFSADRFRPLDQDQEEQPAEREKSKEPSAKPCEIVQGVSYH